MAAAEEPKMFATVGKQGPVATFVAKLAGATLIVPIFLFFVVPLVLLQVLWAFLILPFKLREQHKVRMARLRELHVRGRVVPWQEFEGLAARKDGMAIRDFEGNLWWQRDIPQEVLEIAVSQRPDRRIVKLWQLSTGSEIELMKLTDAYLVELLGRKLSKELWLQISKQSNITMFEFSFKN
jgi:hypothetical protein